MRYAILTTTLMLVASALTIGQIEAAVPEQVTMCELYKNPKVYAGKMVQLRASVTHWDSQHFWLDDFGTPERCEAKIRARLKPYGSNNFSNVRSFRKGG